MESAASALESQRSMLLAVNEKCVKIDTVAKSVSWGRMNLLTSLQQTMETVWLQRVKDLVASYTSESFHTAWNQYTAGLTVASGDPENVLKIRLGQEMLTLWRKQLDTDSPVYVLVNDAFQQLSPQAQAGQSLSTLQVYPNKTQNKSTTAEEEQEEQEEEEDYASSTVVLYNTLNYHETPTDHVESQARTQTAAKLILQRFHQQHNIQEDDRQRSLALRESNDITAVPMYCLPLVHSPQYLNRLYTFAKEAEQEDLYVPLEFDTEWETDIGYSSSGSDDLSEDELFTGRLSRWAKLRKVDEALLRPALESHLSTDQIRQLVKVVNPTRQEFRLSLSLSQYENRFKNTDLKLHKLIRRILAITRLNRFVVEHANLRDANFSLWMHGRTSGGLNRAIETDIRRWLVHYDPDRLHALLLRYEAVPEMQRSTDAFTADLKKIRVSPPAELLEDEFAWPVVGSEEDAEELWTQAVEYCHVKLTTKSGTVRVFGPRKRRDGKRFDDDDGEDDESDGGGGGGGDDENGDEVGAPTAAALMSPTGPSSSQPRKRVRKVKNEAAATGAADGGGGDDSERQYNEDLRFLFARLCQRGQITQTDVMHQLNGKIGFQCGQANVSAWARHRMGVDSIQRYNQAVIRWIALYEAQLIPEEVDVWQSVRDRPPGAAVTAVDAAARARPPPPQHRPMATPAAAVAAAPQVTAAGPEPTQPPVAAAAATGVPIAENSLLARLGATVSSSSGAFVRTQAAPSLRQKDLFCYDVQQWLHYSKDLPPAYVPDGHGSYTRELWCSACHRAEHTFQGKRDLYHHLSICKQAPSLGHRVVREHFSRLSPGEILDCEDRLSHGAMDTQLYAFNRTLKYPLCGACGDAGGSEALIPCARTGVRTQRNRRPSASTPRSRRSSGGGGGGSGGQPRRGGSSGGVRMSVDAYARPYLQRNRVRTTFFAATDDAKEGRSARGGGGGGTGRAAAAATASSSSSRRNRAAAPSSTGRASGGGGSNRRGSRGTTRGSGGAGGASSTARRTGGGASGGSGGSGGGGAAGAKKVAAGSDDIGDGMTDTYVSATTMKAALASAGMACKAVDIVLRHANANAFACIRPPGHHAGRHGCTPGCLSTGFCILNNAAIAMVYARVQHGLQRVAVVDFDVHFGNGTADILKGDPNAFFASVHMVYGPKNDGVPAATAAAAVVSTTETATAADSPTLLKKKTMKPLPAPQPGTAMGFYPAQLGQTEVHDNFICVGVQPENVSRLLTQRAQQWHTVHTQRKLDKEREALQQIVATEEDIDDQDSDDLFIGSKGFLDALRYVIIPRLEAFAPELLILSAGFDGYKTDPIGGALHLTLEDYTQCTTMLMDAMKRVAQRTEDPARASRVVSLLEGGYDTSPSTLGLAKCVERHVSTLRLKGN
eukprot:gene2284-1667_t